MKPFLTKIRPALPVMKAPLEGPKKVRRKREEIDFVIVFHQSPNTFYIKIFLYPPLVPAY